MESTRFTFNRDNLFAIGKVVLWTAVSGALAALIALMGSMEIPTEYAFLVPVVNIVLYALKAFVEGKKV